MEEIDKIITAQYFQEMYDAFDRAKDEGRYREFMSALSMMLSATSVHMEDPQSAFDHTSAVGQEFLMVALSMLGTHQDPKMLN